MNNPHILFITTDEQHLDTVMCEKKPYELKGLKSLLDTSNVYNNAFSVSPVCLPSRCAWVSGLYPHNSGCISNNLGASLPISQANLFTILKDNGYQTSLHGKCHFIPVPYPATKRFLTQEYEHFIQYYKSLGIDTLDLQDDKNNSMWYYDHFSKDLESKGFLKAYRDTYHVNKNVTLPDFPLDAEYHPDSWVGEKAFEHIENCDVNNSQFIWVSFSGPHYPMDAPSKYFDKIDLKNDLPRNYQDGEWEDKTKLHHNGYYGPGTTEGSGGAKDNAQKNYDQDYWDLWRTKYYANIVQIDEYIQKIIDKAKEKFGENLVILFTSDHGDMMGNHNLWGKNHSLYNDVLKVPMILHTPYQTNRKDFNQNISSLEVFPSLLSLANCDIPQNCDGKPFDEICSEGGREYIISECGERVSIIKDNFKLCVNMYEKTQEMYYELYDLGNDPLEYTNLYNDPSFEKHKAELFEILNNQENLMQNIFYKQDETKPYWFKK